MLQIIRVDTLDNRTLDIEFSNGNLILLDINPLLYGDDAYSTLSREKLLPRPRTNGNRIYWQDGPSLAVRKVRNNGGPRAMPDKIKTIVRRNETYETKMETNRQPDTVGLHGI